MKITRRFTLDMYAADDQAIHAAFRDAWRALEPALSIVDGHRYLKPWLGQVLDRAVFDDALLEALADWLAAAREARRRVSGGEGAVIDAASSAVATVLDRVNQAHGAGQTRPSPCGETPLLSEPAGTAPDIAQLKA